MAKRNAAGRSNGTLRPFGGSVFQQGIEHVVAISLVFLDLGTHPFFFEKDILVCPGMILDKIAKTTIMFMCATIDHVY